MAKKTTELKGLQQTIIAALLNYGIDGVQVEELVLSYKSDVKNFGLTRTAACRPGCEIKVNHSTGQLECICPD